MIECRHGLSEDCPGCMQETIDAAFATCIMIVEEECGLDKKPAQGRDNYVHGKYDVGLAIVDRIKCAQRNPDETRMRVPAQRAPMPLESDLIACMDDNWGLIKNNLSRHDFFAASAVAIQELIRRRYSSLTSTDGGGK